MYTILKFKIFNDVRYNFNLKLSKYTYRYKYTYQCPTCLNISSSSHYNRVQHVTMYKLNMITNKLSYCDAPVYLIIYRRKDRIQEVFFPANLFLEASIINTYNIE